MDYEKEVIAGGSFSTEIRKSDILTYDDILTLLDGTTDFVKNKLNDLYDIIHCLSFIDPSRRDYLKDLDQYLADITMPMEDFLDTLEAYQESARGKSKVQKTHVPIYDSDDDSNSSDFPNN